jgi:cytochrome bd-type quinol oxidase subunit 2
MFDDEILRVIWWIFTGIVIIAFTLTSGFDFGIGALLPFVGRNDLERRAVINTIGGTWKVTRSGWCCSAARCSRCDRWSTPRFSRVST